jgi:hypothetical protein
LIEAVELGSFVVPEFGVSPVGLKQAGGERRVNAFEEFEKYQANRISLWAAVVTVGKMAHSIKLEIPDALILVGLWSLPAEGAARWVKRIKESSGSALYIDIEQAIRAIASMVPQVGDELQARVEKQERE